MRARFLAPVLILAALAMGPPPAVAGSPPPPAVSGEATSGPAWVLPMAGEPVVTRPFEEPPHPFGVGHRGVDLLGTPWSPVLAAGDGVVVFAGMVAGRPVVSVDHADGLRTTYEPVDPSVAAGQRVTRGSFLGTLTSGHRGCPGSACLHWGLRRGEVYLDPLALLGLPEVRLLPVG
jgi:murein DD-endopeptidase MepM/ murein hydrolase activator NlpD